MRKIAPPFPFFFSPSFLSFRMDSDSHTQDLTYLMACLKAFGEALPTYSFGRNVRFEGLSFSDFTRGRVELCEFLVGKYWWRAPITMLTFQNPRDDHNVWKEVRIDLPGVNSWLDSEKEREVLKTHALKWLPSLLTEMQVVGMDVGAQLVFENHIMKERVCLSFSVFDPVAKA